ncbi:hypothetical protein PC117_g18005 [Phytophthora cactorum]|uniref:Uncharacterized protein n=1 Tax=Phytophthora cactorum TaxID=29920 RepID=A0A8T1C6N9_9STRA|nr:hypothetical protein PC117_g18005 [Phytophthora cactorum]
MMFVGEDAVATFAIESGFIVGESGESKESVGGDEVLPACEPVTAFQTVALSVKTITEMFGSDRVSQQDADARRSSLTTGWSVDGGESVEDVENVEGNADARVTVAANGVNVMVDKNWHISLGQSILEAVTVATLVDMNLSSGASTRVPDENVVHMDSAFVESLGRQQTQKTVDKDALRRPAWCAQSSSFEPYSGGYQQRTPLHRRVRSKPLLFLP